MNSKNTSKRIEQVLAQPTQYVFDLTDVDKRFYTEAINVLFNNPEFKEAVEKRNRFVRSAGNMRPGSAEITNIVRVIQQHDRKLADTLFAHIVQANLHARVTYETVSLEDMLRDHVDFSKDGMKERVDTLKLNLDKLVFLADMLEGVLVDVKGDMSHVTEGQFEFKQFDAVIDAMTMLKCFFGMVRGKDLSRPDAQLYVEYSDSINEYLTKRLKTYSEKLQKIRTPNP